MLERGGLLLPRVSAVHAQSLPARGRPHSEKTGEMVKTCGAFHNEQHATSFTRPLLSGLAPRLPEQKPAASGFCSRGTACVGSAASSLATLTLSIDEDDRLIHPPSAGCQKSEQLRQVSLPATVPKLILFVLPLGLDTFAISAALGVRGLPPRERLRVSLFMSSFEMAMPIVGLLIGHALGTLVGNAADYVAIVVLALLGAWMLLHEEQAEGEEVAELATREGLAMLALGISISLDELAIGFSIGLLHLSLWLAVILIGVQAFFFAQLGLRLGARLNETLRERAEQLAGVALIGLAALLVVDKLT
jgi:putative Mn2+ efflux pump MntP